MNKLSRDGGVPHGGVKRGALDRVRPHSRARTATCRSNLVMDYAGNILVGESDRGYVRRIRFQRL